MLLGQTVNCDHETNIGNAIGAVSQVMWQESYKDGHFTIPAGINGILKIDGKANPRIARGILMEPPSIHSNSVTVQFKWDKSHPGMEDGEFYQKLGTYDSKGEMVRRIVTEVVRYLETSLVSHGADSFAQRLVQMVKLLILLLQKEPGLLMRNIGMTSLNSTSLLTTKQISRSFKKRTILRVL